jgi:hypothetical protein
MLKFATGNGSVRGILWILIDSHSRMPPRTLLTDQRTYLFPLERSQEGLRIPQVEH